MRGRLFGRPGAGEQKVSLGEVTVEEDESSCLLPKVNARSVLQAGWRDAGLMHLQGLLCAPGCPWVDLGVALYLGGGKVANTLRSDCTPSTRLFLLVPRVPIRPDSPEAR